MIFDVDQKKLISLYNRSKKDADGWASVSNQLWPWFSKAVNTDFFELGEQKIRLTDVGKVMLKYAI